MSPGVHKNLPHSWTPKRYVRTHSQDAVHAIAEGGWNSSTLILMSTRNCAHVYSTIREDHATPELAGTGEYSVVLPFGICRLLYLGVSGSQATYQAISVCAACRQFPWKVRHPADRYLLSYEIQCLPLLASLPIPHARYRQPQYECTLREMGRWLSPGGTAAVSLLAAFQCSFRVRPRRISQMETVVFLALRLRWRPATPSPIGPAAHWRHRCLSILLCIIITNLPPHLGDSNMCARSQTMSGVWFCWNRHSRLQLGDRDTRLTGRLEIIFEPAFLRGTVTMYLAPKRSVVLTLRRPMDSCMVEGTPPEGYQPGIERRPIPLDNRTASTGSDMSDI
ncbi:hypothetical protein B0H13DRAFT_2273307 [Mycena leptocephala]|nr:hypothetical protein B0H13DRAFT_2273307 [Mycena leptocephala]